MPDEFDEAFDSFEECVRTLGDEPSVEDPEALCGWLQEHGFKALRETNPEEVLTALSVEYVSVVDEPAQNSEWLIAKSVDGPTGDNHAWGVESSPILLSKAENDEDDEEEDDDGYEEEEQRKVWAAVLVPGETDRQGDLIPEPEIESAAHEYMANYRKVDADHDLLDGAGVPIESYVLKAETTFDLPNGDTRTYPTGTWVMGVQLAPDAWERVKSGDLTGFSIYGGATPLDPTTLLSDEQAAAVEAAKSMTEISKDVPSNVQSAVGAFFSATDKDPENASVADFLEWILSESDEDDVEIGGVEVSASVSEKSASENEDADEGTDDSGDDGENETMSNDDDTDPENGNGDEQNDGEEEEQDLLKSIRDTVEDTRDTVEKNSSRMDDLDDRLSEVEKETGVADDPDDEDGDGDGDGDGDDEDPAEAAEKAVEKKFRELFDLSDDDDVEEVVRKSRFTDPDDLRDEDGELGPLSFRGLTEEA